MLELLQVLIGAGWIVGSFVNAQIATVKNRNPGGCFVLSLVISPLAVWAYLVAVPSLPPRLPGLRD